MRPAAILLLCACASLVWLAPLAQAADSKGTVRLEIVTGKNISAMAPQRWTQALSQVKLAGLQIRSANAADKIEVIKQGTASAPVYRVIGKLTDDSTLVLPGGKFSINEIGKIRAWAEKLADEGPAGVTEGRGAFGLAVSQLDEISTDLKRPVAFSTLSLPAGQVVERIKGTIKLPLLIDPAASRSLAGIIVADEFEGLSCGTTLAAVLRPAGLAMIPERPAGGKLQYRVARAQTGRDSWPVGWKPAQQQLLVLPKLFDNLNVEIADLPISEALAAIQGRLQVPFIYDRNALAMHGVDPTVAIATVPAKRMSYSQIIAKVLTGTHLQYELRTDEADKPFLWITSDRPAR